MIVSVSSETGAITVTDPFENISLVLPSPKKYWGSSDVKMNGNKIPSARLWSYMSNVYTKEQEFKYETLMEEAKRAEIFRLLDKGMIVWTLNPTKSDQKISENLYARLEKQRARTLVDKFKINIVKCEIRLNEDILKEILEGCASIQLYPCGMVDERIYVTKDPEAVFEAFGSRDWQRIAVYCKRPSASGFQLDL